MRTYAAILAAGSGTRFGTDKTQVLLGRQPLWRWSYDTFSSHPQIAGVILVGSRSNLEALRTSDAVAVVEGGSTRQESSRAALGALPSDAEAILIHDAARPFATSQLISAVIKGVEEEGAAAAAIPVTDTIKQVDDKTVFTLDRSKLVAMQTPQGARVDLLRDALRHATEHSTDDMAMLEKIGIHPRLVPGELMNFKITTADDLARARTLIGSPEVRTGLGYDIHPFSNDPTRKLFLGGVEFPDHPALEGHSDADVLLHAATDALFGAVGMGDIGQHFPNTDERWRGEPSLTFLAHAAKLVREKGWQVVNIDMTVIAETPKVMKRADEIRSTIANALSIEPSRVSVKATTNEKLGSIGRSEGIAAFATATLVESFV